MAKEVKIWKDHKGNEVPEGYISHFDKVKEKKLQKLLKDSKALQKRMIEFNAEMFSEADYLNTLFYKEHHMDVPETKGNSTLFSFDKGIKVAVSVSELVDFDDKINIAQKLLNEFVSEITNDSSSEVRVLINNAFTTTKGRLDKARVFSLFQLKIEHATWVKAMDMIKESITTNSTKRYVNIYERDEKGEYKQVVLNFSSL